MQFHYQFSLVPHESTDHWQDHCLNLKYKKNIFLKFYFVKNKNPFYHNHNRSWPFFSKICQLEIIRRKTLFFFSFQNQMNIIDDNRIVNVMTFETFFKKRGKSMKFPNGRKGKKNQLFVNLLLFSCSVSVCWRRVCWSANKKKEKNQGFFSCWVETLCNETTVNY